MSNIAFQINKISAGSTAAGANLLFDSVSFSEGNVSYNAITGEITISDPGRFALNWWVGVQSNPAASGPIFTAVTTQGDNIVSTSPIKTGEVTGTGVIETSGTVTLRLVNTTAQTVFHPTQSPLSATLVIVQDDETGEGGAGGAIIPYASGTPAVLATVIGQVIGTTTIVGFGDSVPGISVLGGLIDTSTLLNLSFSMPRSGIIDSLAGYFSTTLGTSIIGSTVSVGVEIFRSATPDNIFVSTGAQVLLSPGFTGVVGINEISNALVTGLSIPVTAQTRILCVFFSTVTAGIDLVSLLTGNASAGLGIL